LSCCFNVMKSAVWLTIKMDMIPNRTLLSKALFNPLITFFTFRVLRAERIHIKHVAPQIQLSS
jgi:hypothetical protein